ncbi:MAG: hypothetical protein QOE58_928 [Actinomycetota bacterium]|nr:hypothetical protein [Actinomycetota bacterium]
MLDGASRPQGYKVMMIYAVNTITRPAIAHGAHP